MLPLQLALAAAIGLSASACSKASDAGTHVAGPPVSQPPPNAKGQVPAFPEQTRAPEAKSHVSYKTTLVAEGLDRPWGMAFLPDGRILATERGGQLRIIDAKGAISPPLAGLPKVDDRAQGGLLGIASIRPSPRTAWSISHSRSPPRAASTTPQWGARASAKTAQR